MFVVAVQTPSVALLLLLLSDGGSCVGTVIGAGTGVGAGISAGGAGISAGAGADLINGCLILVGSFSKICAYLEKSWGLY